MSGNERNGTYNTVLWAVGEYVIVCECVEQLSVSRDGLLKCWKGHGFSSGQVGANIGPHTSQTNVWQKCNFRYGQMIFRCARYLLLIYFWSYILQCMHEISTIPTQKQRVWSKPHTYQKISQCIIIAIQGRRKTAEQEIILYIFHINQLPQNVILFRYHVCLACLSKSRKDYLEYRAI